MKFKILSTIFALACLTTPVYAGGLFGDNIDSHDTYNNSQARAKASLRARLSSSARAEQHQKAIAAQGQSLQDNRVTTYEQKYQAPGIALGQGDPGYDCSMTGGVGLSVPGGGGSIQWSDASINCELAMVFKLGRKDAATVDRAYEAFDILFDRVMEQASNEPSKRDPDTRDGR